MSADPLLVYNYGVSFSSNITADIADLCHLPFLPPRSLLRRWDAWLAQRASASTSVSVSPFFPRNLRISTKANVLQATSTRTSVLSTSSRPARTRPCTPRRSSLDSKRHRMSPRRGQQLYLCWESTRLFQATFLKQHEASQRSSVLYSQVHSQHVLSPSLR